MAITQTGSTIDTDSGGSTAETGQMFAYIVIPADTELLIACVTGYTGDASGFASLTTEKGGIETAMTKIASAGDASGGQWQAAMFYMVDPDTGDEQRINWDWAAGSDTPVACAVTCWKGVDTASPIRDSDGIQGGSSFPKTTPTLTAQTGDKILAYFGGYTGGSNGTVDTWSGATLLANLTNHNDYLDGALATANPSGDQTVGVTAVTNFPEGALVACVIKPGGATAYTLDAAAGSYALTGTDATLTLGTQGPADWDADLSDGGTVVGTTFSANLGDAAAAFSVTTHSTGKWYAEVTFTDMGDGLAGEVYVGIGNSSLTFANLWNEDLGIYSAPTGVITGSDPNYTVGNVVSIAVDLDALKFWARKNGGTWVPGTPPSGTASVIEGSTAFHVVAAVSEDGILELDTASFAYAVPSGFTAWSSTAYSVTAATESYDFTGSAASAIWVHKVIAETESYNFTGTDATLTATGGGAVTIEQTGSVQVTKTAGVDTNVEVGPFFDYINVPADTELLLVGVHGYTGDASGLASLSFPKGGIDTAMTKLTSADGTAGQWQAALFYMVEPDTGSGSMFLTHDWAGTTDTPIQAAITCWKGVDLASPVRDSDAVQGGSSYPMTTPSLTAQSGDRIIGYFGGYTAGANGSVDTWSNLTTLANPTNQDFLDCALGVTSPSAATTVGVTAVTSFTDGALCAVVLKPATTSGAATIPADPGSYSFTGTDATPTLSLQEFTIAAEAGSYAMTGTDATFVAAVSPPVYRSSASTAHGTRTDTTVSKPTGTLDGDILIAAVYAGNMGASPTVTPPAGWTQIGTTTTPASGGFNASFCLYWKRAAAEASSYTFTHVSADSTAAIFAYSNCVGSGSPVDVFSQATANTGATITATSITTTTANDRLLFIGHNWSSTPNLMVPPTGMTERHDATIIAADELWATPGATGTRSSTFIASAAWTAFLVALKPGTPVAPPTPSTLAYDATDSDTTVLADNQTYTFPLTVADASGEERLVILAGIGTPISAVDFDACTIDGQTATRVGTVSRGPNDGTSTQPFLTAYRASGTANTSINVVATANCPGGAVYLGHCSCFKLTNADTLLAQASTATDDPVLSLATTTSGTVVGAVLAYNGSGSMSATWTGLTELVDTIYFSSTLCTVASEDISSGETPRAISVAPSEALIDSNDSVAGIALSFNPTAAGAAFTSTAEAGSYDFTGSTAVASHSGAAGIEQTGAVVNSQTASNANTGTFFDFITVPACDIAIAGVTGYSGIASPFAAVTMLKGGVQTPMTRLSGGDAVANQWQASLFYMVEPDAGSGLTMNWDWAGTANTDTQIVLSLTFWNGVDIFSPIRDSDAVQGAGTFPKTTPTLTTQLGDKIVAFFGGYTASLEGSVDTWSGASTLSNNPLYSFIDSAWGTADPVDAQTVGVTGVTAFTEGALAAVVLKPAQPVASLIYETYDTDTTILSNDQTYTFIPVGAASAAGQERLVLLGGVGSGGTWDFDNVTIDGNPATRVGTSSRGPVVDSASPLVTAYRAAGTANTAISVIATADNAGGSVFTGFCALFRLNGAGDFLDQTSAAINDPVLSLDTASHGTACAIMYGYSEGVPTATWTGLTERLDISFAAGHISVASSDIAAGSTPLTVSLDMTPDLDGVTDSVASASFSFAPDAATTGIAITMDAAPGSYSFTGFDVQAFGQGEYSLVAEQGFYNFIGTTVVLGSGLIVDSGAYDFTGTDATLINSTEPTGPIFVNASGGTLTVSAGSVSVTTRTGILVEVTGSSMVVLGGNVGVNAPPTSGADGRQGASTGLHVDVGSLMGV